MNSDIHDLEQRALNLPVKERGKLIHNLILSLDSEEIENEIEREWIEESKRRIDEYKEGKIKAIPLNEAMQKARESLK